MKKINDFEMVKDGEKTFEELNINTTMYCAYIATIYYTGNETIDFNDVIWERDIEPIVNVCRKYGISYITISSAFSGLIETLSKFQELGCKIGSITKVKAKYNDFMSNEKAVIPAIIVEL